MTSHAPEMPALDRPTLVFRQVPLGPGLTAWNLEVTYPQFLSEHESQALKLEFAGPSLANVVDRAIEALLDRPDEGAGAAQKVLVERPLTLDQLAAEIVQLAPAPLLAAVLAETRTDRLRAALWAALEALGFRPAEQTIAVKRITEVLADRAEEEDSPRIIRRITPEIDQSPAAGTQDDDSDDPHRSPIDGR